MNGFIRRGGVVLLDNNPLEISLGRYGGKEMNEERKEMDTRGIWCRRGSLTPTQGLHGRQHVPVGRWQGQLQVVGGTLSRCFLRSLLALYFYPCLSPNCRAGTGLEYGGSVQFSRSFASDSLRHHESQHARPPCPSPTPGVYSNSCPSSRWCHPAISSSVVPFSSCPQSLQHQGIFQWVNSSHEVANVLEFQLQHQSFQWTPEGIWG